MTAPTVAVTGSAVVSRGLARAADGMTPPELLHGASQVVGWVTDAAVRACRQARLGGDTLASAHCCFGTLYGTNHVAEYNFLVLGGPRALNPRAFTLFPPNAAVASICGELGITGPGLTLVGMDAGVDAVEYGLRALRAGRCRIAVCGGFDWPTPFAARLLHSAGVPVSPEVGAAVALVLENPGAARERGATVLAELALLSDSSGTPRRPSQPTLTPAVAPLVEVATLLEARRAAPVGRLALTTVPGRG